VLAAKIILAAVIPLSSIDDWAADDTGEEMAGSFDSVF
jgi:hypothetical protein